MKPIRILFAIVILSSLIETLAFSYGVSAQSLLPAMELLIDPATAFERGGLLREPAASANGRRIVFTGYSSKPSNSQIYLYETTSHSTRIISRPSEDSMPDGRAFQPAISADGLFISFSSLATNLITTPSIKDLNGLADVYLYNLLTGRHERISNRPDGYSANGWSATPVISGDGRYILFVSNAADIVPGLGGHRTRIFLYDQRDRTLELIAPLGRSKNQETCAQPAISTDGRFVAYTCRSEESLQPAFYLLDKLVQHTLLIPSPNETQLHNNPDQLLLTSFPVLSADGRELAIMVSNNQITETWLYNHATQTTEVIFLSSGSRNVPLFHPQLSSDGETITLPHYSYLAEPVFSILRIGASPEVILSDLPLAYFDFHPALINNAREVLIAGELPNQNQVFQSRLYQQSIIQTGGQQAEIAGWVTTADNKPLQNVILETSSGLNTNTRRDGSFKLEALYSGSYQLTPQKQGFRFEPATRAVQIDRTIGQYGVQFRAFPDGIIEAARADVGMPYSLNRGCPSPIEPCDGSFNGYYSGDCTDLIIDAFQAGAGFHLEYAILQDARLNPHHYYRWRSARSSQDLWRFFAYTGQLVDKNQDYLPGDIVFFDWEGDAIMDHVAIVSAVNNRSKPTRLIDATGIVDYNPAGLAIELDWKPIHAQHTPGHARWSGGWPGANLGQPVNLDNSFLLFSLESPDARLVIETYQEDINPIEQLDLPSGIPLGGQITSYFIEAPVSAATFQLQISSHANSAPYQVGIQLVRNGLIVQNEIYNGELTQNNPMSFLLNLHQTQPPSGFQLLPLSP